MSADEIVGVITTDGDTCWVECEECGEPVWPIDAGDMLSDLVAAVRRHVCGQG